MGLYIAVDLGAESGRVIRGEIFNGKISITEAARFPTGMIRIHGRMHWNIIRIYEDILAGIRRAIAGGPEPLSIGIDTWGVDFALLARDGSLLGLPVAYRDSRTDAMMEDFFKIVPRDEIYSRTGIQFMQINTLYQLFAMSRMKSPLLPAAAHLLMIPDFFNYLLTGRMCSEFTNATTSQLFNADEACWDTRLIAAAGLDAKIFCDIVYPGVEIGRLLPDVAKSVGAGAVPVVVPATHDTGSAVAAVPACGGNWAYISSGTWSLMGVENNAPVTDSRALQANFTNEGGAYGTWRFLKNIMGLWLVQRCRMEFDKQYSYDELANMAEEAPAFRSIVRADDVRFLNPAAMTGAISEFCRETNQSEPDTPGAFARCAMESLALQYRLVLDQLRENGRPDIERIHVLGGGSKNELLCRMTAQATGLPVLAGPEEATAMGNIVVQAIGCGELSSLAEGRAVIARSCEPVEYLPEHQEQDSEWEDAYAKYIKYGERE